MSKAKTLALAFSALTSLAALAASPAYAAVNGCCQSTPDGGKHCGAPVTVLGKKTCTVGWYKASCKTAYKNCEKKDWMLAGPKLKAS